MKSMVGICMILLSLTTLAQNIPRTEKCQRLPFGSIKPTGWLKAQMQNDMAGFVGKLDQLVHKLINDPIYGAERLRKHSKAKDLGNLKANDSTLFDQYKWWNSETQSNWWDGYIRNALLLDDSQATRKVQNYVYYILSTQDEDGYLGIYDKDVRYKFTSENGELWSKASLYRGLLAYYEYTLDKRVWDALVRAVDNVMKNYPINQSQPFFAGKEYSGGVAHGLTLTDVLDRMHQLTGEPKYTDYAAFLYLNFSTNYSSDRDAQLANILDPGYKLVSHGVHTYEHVRPLIVAAYTTGTPELLKALNMYLSRIELATTIAGGAIGDEWIDGRTVDATRTGYEYCSLQELMDSYSVVFQTSENPKAAEEMETIFYNAAQGSRNPDHSGIAYLKTDNSYEMMGTRNGEIEPNKKQTRYKYSPAHQDVAVCCVPNAGRISPYFVQSCWFKEGENTLVAATYGPNILKTRIKDIPVEIEEVTEYPYQNKLLFKISPEKSVRFQIKFRKPEWARSIKTQERFQVENGFIVFDRLFSKSDKIEMEFLTDVQVIEDPNHENYFKYGALVYARPIPSTEKPGKVYAPGFKDFMYTPLDTTKFGFIQNHQATYNEGKIQLNLENMNSKTIERVELIPFGRTILRQVSFKEIPYK
jgi:hypothetical protein